MSDANAVARDQLRAFIERIERLEEEKKTIADDIKDVYGEAKGTGFDTKVLRKLISIRKQDRDERAEQEAILDMYMIALGMVDEPAAYDEPRQPAPAQRQPAMALRADGGLSILTKHEDIRTAPVTANEFQAKASGDNGATEQDIEDTADSVTGDASRSSRGDDSPATNPEMDRATEGSFETGSEAAEKGRKATATIAAPADLNHAGAGESPAADQPLTGGDHEVASSATRAGLADPTSNTGEGAACALPADGIVMEYVPQSGVKRLPFASCFPELSKAEYDRLEKDIAVNRVREPIIRQGDVIIDGWNRYTIARKYGFSYPVQEYTGADVLLDLIEWQRAARNFTTAQKKKIAADLAKELPRRADDIMAAFGLVEALEDVA